MQYVPFVGLLYIYKRVYAGIQGAHMDGVNAYGEENLFENENIQ